jgi:hypothetical protein
VVVSPSLVELLAPEVPSLEVPEVWGVPELVSAAVGSVVSPGDVVVLDELAPLDEPPSPPSEPPPSSHAVRSSSKAEVTDRDLVISVV